MTEEKQDINFTESKRGRHKGLDRPIKLLWPFIRLYKLQVIGALVGVAVAASTVLAFGWGLRQLVDKGFSDPSGAYLNQALLVLFGVILVLAAASYTRFFLVYWIAERVSADLRKKIFAKLLDLDPAYFEQNKTGEEVSRLNSDTTVLQMAVATNLPVALRHTLTLIGGIILMITVSPCMAGLTLLVVPVVIAPIIIFGRKVRARSKDTQARIGEMSSFGHEALQGMQTIQTFNYELRALSIFSGLADGIFLTALKYIKVRAFLTAFVISMVFGAIGLVLWMGGRKVLLGAMSAGDLSSFVFYAVIVSGAVGALSEAMGAFQQAVGASDRITGLLNTQSSLRGMAALPMPVSGAITFNQVSFRYPSRPEYSALDNVSFDIAAGQIVALVGPSGAGKSTLFQLLQRFYDPQKGTISFDDKDTALYCPQDIRRCLTVVQQDPAVFSMSVADNIRIGRPDATDEDVRHAAELAQAHEFIMQMPDGYMTQVGERGNLLSGGQKQRLAIARAILKDARILLLDEATSALDSSNELAVHVALKHLMKGRTTLIIAHRLSTIQNADKIIVLDKGRVLAQGTHDELYGQEALYTHLAGLQMDVKKGA